MKQRPAIGTAHQRQYRVEPQHTIDFAGGGMPAVLSTPALVGMLERTARELMEPWLEADERTVGTEIELRHLAPTPAGATVTCTVRVVRTEGALTTFQIEARDEQELIARGLHQRAVIRVDRFAQRLARKGVPSPS